MHALRFWNQIETPLNNTKHDPINDAWIDNFMSLTNHHDQQQLTNELVEFDSNYSCLLPDEELLFKQRNWSINPQKVEYFDIYPQYVKNQIPSQQQQQQEQPHIIFHQDEVAAFNSHNMSSPSQAETNDLLSPNMCSFVSNKLKQNNLKPENSLKTTEIPKVFASKKISDKNKDKKKIRNNRRISERLKNIVKNYGKNCATFAIGELGAQYINQKLSSEQISKFKEWIRIKIPSITNIKNLREMLLISPNDDNEIKYFKQTFQYASEIFIKNYSFNWIFHSPRINDKKGHIYARFKMLRRIKDPKSFTYIH